MSLLRRGGYYPRPTRAYLPHIQHGSTFALGDEQLAVRWHPYGLCIRATVLLSPRGLRVNVSAMGCTRHPPRFSPQGVACGAEGGTADFRTTTSGAAPTSPPEGVFRSIPRKKYRRAVGTHYGPTRTRQAGISLCHRRDGRAGTTILQLVSAPDVRTRVLQSDYGPAGLPEQGQRRRIRRSRRIVLRDYGQEEAASSRRRAVGTAGPFQGLRADQAGSSGRRRRLRRGRSTFRGTTGRTDPPDGYAGGHRGKRTTRPRDLSGAGRRVSPMHGTRSQALHAKFRRAPGRVPFHY
jgi:hypothetical protein